MSPRPTRGAALIYGLFGGVLLLAALGLIGVGLMRMTASGEATPFRSACQGDDACRAALAERLPGLQALPGGAPALLRDALTRSAPVLAPDATLSVCQATGTPESCALDSAKLKPGEAGALIAILDAQALAVTRQGRACRDMESCATRALAALGEYGFDPVRLQGALQRTSYPLPPPLKACAEAGPETVQRACEAEALLRAAPEPLTVALEQDWRSGGAQARLPHPADPQAELTKDALWAALGAALGMLAMGAAWTGGMLLGGTDRKGRLTKAAQGGPIAAGAPDMAALAPRPAFEPDAPSDRPAPQRRPTAAPPLAMASPEPSQKARGTVVAPAAQPADRGAPAPSPRSSPPPPALGADPRAPGAAPNPAVAAFQAALSIPGEASTFARLAADEGARLSPRFDEGERLAAGAILAAHRLRGDRPAETHAGAYDDLILSLAGAGHRLVWPRPGAPITAEMSTCDEGDLYSHTVEAVVRPGLVDGSGALVLRARVRAR